MVQYNSKVPYTGTITEVMPDADLVLLVGGICLEEMDKAAHETLLLSKLLNILRPGTQNQSNNAYWASSLKLRILS
jgi:hypothetical protein